MTRKTCCIASTLLFLILTLSGCGEPVLTVYYEEKAQLELVSSRGKRILIDVYEPSRLSGSQSDSDILLTTHTHPDHYNFGFYYEFKGTSLFVREGKIETADIKIQSIFGSHNEGDGYKKEDGTNYIFIIDMDDLRIVHFGDLGQNALTPEQVSTIGEVDIAIMQFYNSYSMMGVNNKKGFNLINQINPKLIIPTHINNEAAKYARTLWDCYYSDGKALSISRRNLPKKTQLLFLGNDANKYAELTKANKWKK